MNLSVFTVFRKPKLRRHGDWPATEFEASEVPPGGQWPWPDIDRPSVQLLQDQTAFHEAGHAVVARYFGVKVSQLSIRRRANSLGRVFPLATPAQQRTKRYADLRRCADRNPESRHRIPVGVLHPRSLFDYEESLQAELHTTLAGAVAEEMQFSSCTGSGGDWRLFQLRLLGRAAKRRGDLRDDSPVKGPRTRRSGCGHRRQGPLTPPPLRGTESRSFPPRSSCTSRVA